MEYHIIDYWLGKRVCALLLTFDACTPKPILDYCLAKPHQTNCCHPLACVWPKNLYHKHIYTFWMRVIDVCKKTFKVRREVYKNHSWLLALDLQSMTSGKKSFQSQNKF